MWTPMILKTLVGVVPFFVIISLSGKEKWLSFDDQSGAHEHDHKHSPASLCSSAPAPCRSRMTSIGYNHSL